MNLDLSKFIFVDHHCHSLLKGHSELDTFGFRQCFTESRSRRIIEEHIPASLHYMDLLNSMSRILTTSDEESLISRRCLQQEAGWVRTLWDDVSLGGLIVDDGYRTDEMLSIAQLSAIAQRPIYACRRIENVLESCLERCGTFGELRQMLPEKLLERNGPQIVALKTIVAYRGGLIIGTVSEDEARDDYESRKSLFKAGFALQSSPFYHFLLRQIFHLAGEKGLPVQIHTGMGDDDANLLASNPAHLQDLLGSKEFARTNFVLLHCFPYVREAALLSALFGNVYMDLSLSVSQSSGLARQMILEALAAAPSSKILAGTDGHSCPESHWFGAISFTRGLSHALQNLIASQTITDQQALKIAAAILHGNAIDLYKLEGLV